MDGIGLDNMMGAEELQSFFGNQETSDGNENSQEASSEEETSGVEENSETKEKTAEVDFSDLLGESPESVGSEGYSEGNGETPASNKPGTPQDNLFSSIARILRDKGVFPDLSDDALQAVSDEEALEKLFNDKVSSMLDERQQRLEKALNSGASSNEVQAYQNALQLSQYLDNKDTYNTLIKEGDEGEKLRKQVMYQDYVNRGFSHERAVKMIEKSFVDGSDMEDAKDAYNSCKEFYKKQVDDFQQEMEDRQAKNKAAEEKQYNTLKKHILDTESFYDGVKVDKATRQKAYDAITKPVWKDEQGNYLTALQKFQREKPLEFMENVALLFAITGEFKSVQNLAKGKVKEGLKKGFAELESVINSSRRNDNGTLNLANTGPDDEREHWSLAI